ncbi:MAG: hypothetical protein JW820_10955 [Spirochaetales bacterium]|nr:hypothetical protein [Spirochaetales bacterium]
MKATRRAPSQLLSGRRLGLLLRRDLAGGYRGVLIAMAAVGGFLILSRVVSAFSHQPAPVHPAIYAQLLFIGGFIVTSLAFRELHLDSQSIFYLTLPGSALEKFLSKLLVSSVGYALGSLVFYSAVSAAAEGISRLIFGTSYPFFNPLDRNVLLAAAAYLVTQSVFLVGSLYFRRLAFVKTVLYLVLFGIVLGIVSGLAAWIVFRDYAMGRSIIFQPYLNQLGATGELERILQPLAEGFWRAARLLFWIAVAPVGWVIGYLRLRETEV